MDYTTAIEKAIKREGKITIQTRKRFFSNLTANSIRDWLEQHGFDRHMPIEFEEIEIALFCSIGLLMKESDNSLMLWGGVLSNEKISEGAIRILNDETGRNDFEPKDLHFVDKYCHIKMDKNGDQSIFATYRFIVSNRFACIYPKGKTKVMELHDIYMVLEHQQYFVKKLLTGKIK